MARLDDVMGRAVALLLALGCVPGGADAGPALDALDGRWTVTHCADPATGTWTVLGNKIQFLWPKDRASDALEEVVSEVADVIETVVVSPDAIKGRRYRYSIVGEDVLIDSLSDGKQLVVHRCR
jgi:hypothetical protein